MTNSPPSRISGKRWVYLSILLILLLFNGYFFVSNYRITTEKEEALARAQEAETLRDKAENDYRQALQELESVKSQLNEERALADSLETNLNLIKFELDKLLSSRSISDSELRKAKALVQKLEIGARRIAPRMDSLSTLTKKLLTEKQTLEGELTTERMQITRLKDENSLLIRKVDMINLLEAQNISGNAIRIKPDGTTVQSKKAKDATRLILSFSVEKNPVVDIGQKTVYLQVKGPGGILFSESRGSGTIELKESGMPAQYTLKVVFDYKAQPQVISAYWEEGNISPGTYDVTVFYDKREAGKGSFTLR